MKKLSIVLSLLTLVCITLTSCGQNKAEGVVSKYLKGQIKQDYALSYSMISSMDQKVKPLATYQK